MMMCATWRKLRNAGLIENSSDWFGLAAAVTATAVDDDDDKNDDDAFKVVLESFS